MVYAEQLARINVSVDSAATTSRTLAFKESGALDATYLLVAHVQIATGTALVAPDGWVERGTGGANSTNQMRTYVKQGDGVTNSVTIASASAVATVVVQAYAGFVSLTPILAGGANGGTGTQFPFSGISGQAGNGVALLGIGLSTAPSSWSGWSAGTPTPALADLPAGARGWWVTEDYIDGTGAANTTVTWLGSRSQRYIAVVMPLAVVSAAPAVTGTASSVLPSPGQAAAGDVTSPTDPAVTGDVASQLPAPTSSASGTSSAPDEFTGTAASVLPAPTSAASGTVENTTPPNATRPPKQSEMPAAPFDLYPAPGMSWIVGPAPSGSGYVSVAPDHPYIKLLGHATKGVQAGSVSGFINPAPLQDIAGAGTGTNPLVFPPYAPRILTNSPEVWFRLAQRSYSGFSNVSSRAAVRLRVNGKWVSLTPIYLGSTLGFPSNPENITAGEYAYKLTFPDSQTREIELNTHLEFGGVVIPAGYFLYEPRAISSVVALLDGSLGGAEKHQTGNYSLNSADGSGAAATYTAVSSYLWAAAQSLGYDSVVNSAAGSSGGSINGDTASWKSTNKVPRDVSDHFPDMAVVGGANNDMAAGQTAAQVDAAFATVYGNVVAGAKAGAILVAFGMFTAPAMGSQASAEAAVAPYNDVLKARAQQYGFWFINPTTGQTFDPQGNLRRTTSNWVYQDTSDIASDNTHPSQRGANNLGVKFADAIRMAHVDDIGATGTASSVLPGPSQSAQGSAIENGQATASGALALSGSASYGAVATAVGTLSLSGASTSIPGLLATGAMVLGGSAAAVEVGARTAPGSLSLSGYTSAGAVTNPQGTLVLSGAATWLEGAARTPSGTLALAGSATARETATRAPSGSMSLTGSSVQQEGGVRVVAGILALGGAAVVLELGTRTASGALTLSGVADAAGGGVRQAVGSFVLSGTSREVQGAALAASGVLALSGVADASGAAVRLAQGVLTLSGSAVAQEVAARSADGSMTLTGSAPILEVATRSASAALMLAGATMTTQGARREAVGALVLAGSATGVETAMRAAVAMLFLSGSVELPVPVIRPTGQEWEELFMDWGIGGDGKPLELSLETYMGAGTKGPRYATRVAVLGLPQFPQQRLVRTSEGNEATSTAAVYAPLEMREQFTLHSRVQLASGRDSVVLAVQEADNVELFSFLRVDIG